MTEQATSSGEAAAGTGAAATGTEVKVAAPAGGTEQATVKTVLTEVKEVAPAAAPATWPDNWRSIMAGEDAKELKRLERFQSPAEVYKSNRELESRISSGEFKKPLAKDATPDQIKAWRTENGIPEAADKYDLKLADGVKFGEADKPYVAKFLEKLHGKNATNEQATEALNAYHDIMTDMNAKTLAKFEAARDVTKETLTKEWGGEYNKNLNLIQGLIDTMPETARNDILQGVGRDGIPLMSKPDVMRWLTALARQTNPAAGIQLPGSSTVDAKSIEGRMNELKVMMGKDTSEYWKGPQAAKLQEEYRELDAAFQAMKKKAA